MLLEVNSETDFVARDEGFLGFVGSVLDAAFAGRETDVSKLMAGELEQAREALVQKVGENITVRRAALMTADDGVVGSYVHGNNRIAVLVGLSGGDQDLARDVAMHVAAVSPRVVSPQDMPEAVIAKEKDIYTAQAIESGKPQEIIDKMIGGRIQKFMAENSLVEQAFRKGPRHQCRQAGLGGGCERGIFHTL